MALIQVCEILQFTQYVSYTLSQCNEAMENQHV